MKYWLCVFLLIPILGCATEKLIVRVVDQDDKPLSGVLVTVDTRKDIWYRNYWTDLDSELKYISVLTGTNGIATVKFSCPCAYFGWTIKRDGYYHTDGGADRFKEKDVSIATCLLLGKIPLEEHEKHAERKLYKRINPIPMYAYGWFSAKIKKTPYQNGRYGFDLKVFDWLPPYGKGEVADFYYVRDRKDTEWINEMAEKGMTNKIFLFKPDCTDTIPQEGTIVGRIEFENGGGAYVEKKRTKQEFISVYCADTNATYTTSFPIKVESTGTEYIKKFLQEGNVIQETEYMIIRSRVKKNDKGEIISAHYSKLYGPWGFGEGMRMRQLVFNPTENDSNLEVDVKNKINKKTYDRPLLP